MAGDRNGLTYSILRIPVRAGAEDLFAQTFKDLEVFDHASRIDGFRGGRVFRPLAVGEPFVVVAEWDRPDAYQAWLQAPVRDELARAMDPLLAGEMAGAVYSVVEEWG
jgi:heme-degrading monooxygenase HmoA